MGGLLWLPALPAGRELRDWSLAREQGQPGRSRPLGPGCSRRSPVVSLRFAFVLKYRNLCRIEFCN